MITFRSLTPRDLAMLAFRRAVALCDLNGCVRPKITVRSQKWSYRACGYWRGDHIRVCLPLCARLALDTDVGRDWSWPGNAVDREPYGVVLHELGHHFDMNFGSRVGRYTSDLSAVMRRNSGEEPISTYCGNDGEWFAEMFRVFASNPMLLKVLRPRTYELMTERWKPLPIDVVGDERSALGSDCPQRVLTAVRRKIDKARRSQYAKQKVW